MGAVQRQPRGVLPPGTRVGRYELLRRLAKGGMAELYLARARGIHGFEKLVVLKLVLPHLAEDRQFVEMFLHEARLAATLDHPNIVHVTDIGEVDGEPFFVMEYVHGQDLASVLRSTGRRGKPLPLGCALTIGCGVATGLHYVHERTDGEGRYLGLVHRDVSPSNVVISYDGGIKLVDFGIAKATELAQATRAGVLKGKVQYMSPEQCHGDPVDRRTDVFSLGILLYEGTTGQRLFSGDNDFHVMSRIVRGVFAKPSEIAEEYPAPLERIVMRALATKPDDRYPSAQGLLEDLQDFATQARIATSSLEVQRTLQKLFGDQPPPHVDDVDDISPTALHPDALPRDGSLPSEVRTTMGSMQATGLRPVSGHVDAPGPTAVLPGNEGASSDDDRGATKDTDSGENTRIGDRVLVNFDDTNIGEVRPRVTEITKPAAHSAETTNEEVPKVAVTTEEVPKVAVTTEEVPKVAVTTEEVPKVAVTTEEVPKVAMTTEEVPRTSTVVAVAPSASGGSTVVSPAPMGPAAPSLLFASDSLEAVGPLGNRGWLWPVALLGGAAAVAGILLVALGGRATPEPATPDGDVPAAVSGEAPSPRVIEAAPVPADPGSEEMPEVAEVVAVEDDPESAGEADPPPGDAPPSDDEVQIDEEKAESKASSTKRSKRRSSKRKRRRKRNGGKGPKLDSMYPQ